MNPHKNLIIGIASGILFTACGGAVATPLQITAAPEATTAQPTATIEPTAHPTKLVGGCEPFSYDGVTYDLGEKDQIVDFRSNLRLVVATCIVDVPMIIDSHADANCPVDAAITFDTFGGGNCQFRYQTDTFEVYQYLSWGHVQSQWPKGAPSAGPDEYPDELPWPIEVTPPDGPQA